MVFQGPARVQRRGPSAAKTAATRREIVLAATDAFLEHGFSDTRMIDVAQKAGVAKGTLYLYFADKQALFEGVIGDVLAAPIDHMGHLAPAAGESVRAFLARVVQPFLSDLEASKRAAVVRLVIAEGARFPAIAQAHRRLALEPILQLIRRLAAQAFERGEIASEAPICYPQLLLAPAFAAIVWNGLFIDDRLDAGAMFEANLDLVFGAPTPNAKGG